MTKIRISFFVLFLVCLHMAYVAGKKQQRKWWNAHNKLIMCLGRDCYLLQLNKYIPMSPQYSTVVHIPPRMRMRLNALSIKTMMQDHVHTVHTHACITGCKPNTYVNATPRR